MNSMMISLFFNCFTVEVEKLESRNSVLSRENELLKHQLKKYVGAVQKLRDGPQVELYILVCMKITFYVTKF